MSDQQPETTAITSGRRFSGDSLAPVLFPSTTYEVESVDADRSRLTLTHGNSPSQEAADAMIESGWRPMLQSLKEVAEIMRTNSITARVNLHRGRVALGKKLERLNRPILASGSSTS